MKFNGDTDNFEIKPDYAYGIDITSDYSLVIDGYLPGHRDVDLEFGTPPSEWNNYIGWTTHHTEIDQATFESLIVPSENYWRMSRWDVPTQSWMLMDHGPEDVLTPGKGYLVQIYGPAILAYNEASLIP